LQPPAAPPRQSSQRSKVARATLALADIQPRQPYRSRLCSVRSPPRAFKRDERSVSATALASKRGVNRHEQDEWEDVESAEDQQIREEDLLSKAGLDSLASGLHQRVETSSKAPSSAQTQHEAINKSAVALMALTLNPLRSLAIRCQDTLITELEASLKKSLSRGLQLERNRYFACQKLLRW
jgi:hypothetical protein